MPGEALPVLPPPPDDLAHQRVEETGTGGRGGWVCQGQACPGDLLELQLISPILQYQFPMEKMVKSMTFPPPRSPLCSPPALCTQGTGERNVGHGWDSAFPAGLSHFPTFQLDLQHHTLPGDLPFLVP